MAKRGVKRERKTPRAPRRRLSLIRRRQNASIYFLLWTVFAVFALFVVLVYSFTQQALLVHTYKDEAAKELAVKGREIKEALLVGPPSSFGENNYNGFVRFLGSSHDVGVIVLDEQGRLIYPKDPGLQPDSPEYEEYYNHADDAKKMLAEIAKRGEGYAIYGDDGEYIYASELALYEDAPMYLRVSKSMHLMENARASMGIRTVLIAVFVFVLSFAISSALAGWLVDPLIELTRKAHLLAEGNFDVNFHGNDYGQELVELADSLNHARDELAKTDRMQKELIANVSHDFKTPLTMIKGYASMIIEISGDNPEKRNKHAQIIVDEADRLASLVNDVLDLSKISAGIAQLDYKELDMSAYVREVLDRFAYLKDTQGYCFVADIEEGLYARADELKIGQALYNLIGNAVNYTGEDKRVFVSLRSEGDYFRFSVTDTGVGIKQEELAEIWDRYYRSSEMHKRPVKGTGLGLSIVKTILERHGFGYGVDSEVGKGSTFFVIFPKNG